jgi:uncharacterized protein YbjT (DUF2867 family)
MHIVMGGTGHVGSATAQTLLRLGEPVTIITRNPTAASSWRSMGAEVAIADAEDADALRAAFRTGRRALLVNPPGDPTGDPDAAEHRTIDAILDALDGSGLEKVVAVSTYGAQPGTSIGDLGTLWRLEEGLQQQDIPAAVNRGAYYLTNWDMYVDTVRESGVLPSMFPADMVLPMVAPADLGEAAARRLLSALDDTSLEYVEGPERWTPADVAAVLSTQLGRPVEVQTTPRDGIEQALSSVGFSPAGAASYAAMTRLTIDGVELPDHPRRGTTTLGQHFRAVLASSPAGSTQQTR